MIRSRLVARNVLVSLVTQLVSWGLTFAVTLYLPRYLGDAGLGKLTFAGSLVGVFAVFVPLGTSGVLVKEIARDRSRTGELLLAAIFLRVPLSLIMTSLVVATVTIFRYPEITRSLVTIFALGMTVGTLNDALSSALQGQENMTRQSFAIIVNKFLSSALTILLVLQRSSLVLLAAVGLLTGAISLLVNMAAFRGMLSTLQWPTMAAVRGLAVAGLPFMGWSVFQTLYGQTDPIVLSLVANDATVGWYALAFRLVGTSLFFPVAITSALLPTLSRTYSESMVEYQILTRRTLSLVMLFGFPAAVIVGCVPDQLIALLHYPSTFVQSIPVLRIGSVSILLYFAATVLGTAVIASDGQHRMFRASVAAAMMGIPACFLGSYLTNRFWSNGATGAMASDALLEVYLIVYYLRTLPPGTVNAGTSSILFRCFATSILMAGGLVYMVRHGMGLWSVFVAVLLYAIGCWQLRCFDPSYVTLFRNTFFRKLTS